LPSGVAPAHTRPNGETSRRNQSPKAWSPCVRDCVSIAFQHLNLTLL
jgi:hypothetical protein